jgi:lipid II:glycine glycyltransferase (peptidoglycan interpeptide bridge formation enzyme)
MKEEEERRLVGYFNKRLHWEDMKYFKNLGYSVYDWGGFSHKQDDKVLMGINAFKKSFGGVEREVVTYGSILQVIVEIVSRIKKKLWARDF